VRDIDLSLRRLLRGGSMSFTDESVRLKRRRAVGQISETINQDHSAHCSKVSSRSHQFCFHRGEATCRPL